MRQTPIRQFLQYIVVGGTCTSIDFVILYLLTIHGGVHYLLSSSISFTIGVVLNWLLCTYWVFQYHRFQQQSKEFACYVFISFGGLMLNTVLMWLYTELLSFWFMFSKLFSAVLTLFYNFYTRKLLLHTKWNE